MSYPRRAFSMKFSADTLGGSRQKKIDRSIGRCMWRVAFVLEDMLWDGDQTRKGVSLHHSRRSGIMM
jgi:hypothetical protein